MRLTWFGLLAVVCVLSLTACAPLTFTVGVSPAKQQLESTIVRTEGGRGGDRVAIIDISGLIINANRPTLLGEGENPLSLLHEQLELAAGDEDVKAVILRLNTPGGAVTASDAMYREIDRFRKASGKPVVALMMDVAASGGYYVACAADEIVAYPSTITGSIGVIAQTLSVKPALDRWGIQAVAITSGPNKAAGSPLSVLTEEQRRVFQGMVDDFYGQFLDRVRAARPNIPADKFEMVTDGRVVTGRDAVGLGLVDRTGDLDVAHARAKDRAGIDTADLVVFHRPQRYVGSPYAGWPAAGSGAASSVTQVNLAQINLSSAFPGSGMGFYYLWWPLGDQ